MQGAILERAGMMVKEPTRSTGSRFRRAHAVGLQANPDLATSFKSGLGQAVKVRLSSLKLARSFLRRIGPHNYNFNNPGVFVH